jgi:hypothetical protein
MTEKNLRNRYREGLETRTSEGRAGCVTADEMIALAERTLPEAERLRLLDHVMGCPHCRREFALADSVAERGTRGGRLGWYLAVAALLVTAAGVSLLLRTGPPSPEPIRGDDTALTLIEPLEDAGTGAPRRFMWRSVEAGAEYRLEILNAGGSALYHASTTDTSAVLPDSVHLHPGARYSWWVRASLQNGRQAASDIRRLRVTSP